MNATECPVVLKSPVAAPASCRTRIQESQVTGLTAAA